MNGVAHDHVGEAPRVVPPVSDPAFKRLFDLVLAGLGLMLTLPIWMIVVVWIWLDDRGPVFFRQERIGRFGKPIRVLKFRSMIRDHGSIELQASPNDPRITRVGRVLRRTALDELPQLWNILVGDMSFVGPRALPEKEIVRGEATEREFFIRDVPELALRQLVRPGLTGIAQLYAPREIPHRQKFRYDLIYVKKILKRTPSFPGSIDPPITGRRRRWGGLALLRKDMQLLWLDVRLVLQSIWVALGGRWAV